MVRLPAGLRVSGFFFLGGGGGAVLGVFRV